MSERYFVSLSGSVAVSGLLVSVGEALVAVEAKGDTADVALRLAGRIDAEGVTPSLVRELRYALLSLGVVDLGPYRDLMVATKAAIDSSDDGLPTLAAQLREQEQTCRRLGAEPANAPVVRAVRAAVDDLLALWAQRWGEFVAGVQTDWPAHRGESNRLWKIVDDAGGQGAFPVECDQASAAFDGYWQGRRRFRRGASLE